MRTVVEIPDSLGAAAIDAALEGLVGVGVEDLMGSIETSGEALPPLYSSGVVYEREHGTERWLTPSQVLGRGRGDCEDLAAWRAAELRVSGLDPEARARVIRSGPRSWHAVVERSDGSTEDPSRALGMAAGDAAATLGDWRFTCDPTPGGGWQCVIARDGAGVVGRSHYGHDAINRAIALGLVGQIPGLDIIARAAQAAMAAALPGLAPPGLPPAAAPGAEPAGGDLDAATRRIARTISRLATTEANRKLRDAARRVSGVARRARA